MQNKSTESPVVVVPYSPPSLPTLKMGGLIRPLIVGGVLAFRQYEHEDPRERPEVLSLTQPPDKVHLLAFEGRLLGNPLNETQKAFLKHYLLAVFSEGDDGRKLFPDAALSELEITDRPVICTDLTSGCLAEKLASGKLYVEKAEAQQRGEARRFIDLKQAVSLARAHLETCRHCRWRWGPTYGCPQQRLLFLIRQIIGPSVIRRVAALNRGYVH